MPLPYRSDEVAEAVVRRLRGLTVTVAELRVVGNEVTREWIVTLGLPGGQLRRLRFPLSTEEGITTPAEVADGCARALGSG